mgnify:CR=1 FL=1
MIPSHDDVIVNNEYIKRYSKVVATTLHDSKCFFGTGGYVNTID